jgi:hypothetical protein
MKSDTQNSADITIADFCDIHDSCNEGRKWALSTGMTTMSELWTHPELPHEWRIWIFCRESVASERNQRLFAVWCARQVQHMLPDPRSIAAIDVAERFANGQATSEELASAREAANLFAAWETASFAASAAASAAAWYAARDATVARATAMKKQAHYLTTTFPTWDFLTK